MCTRVNKIGELTRSNLDQCGREKKIRSRGRCEVGMARGHSDPKWTDCRKVAAKWILKIMTNEPKVNSMAV